MSGKYEEGRQEGRQEERAALFAKLVASGMSETQATLILKDG
jgi:hypothetical protein